MGSLAEFFRDPRVIEVISALAENPFLSGCRKLKGAENFYRVRVGEYRIIYQVNVKEKITINMLCSSPGNCL